MAAASDPTLKQFEIGAALAASATDGDIAEADKTVGIPADEEAATWRWYRGSAEISGQTTANYTVTAADVGSRIRVVVTYRCFRQHVAQESAELTSDYPVLRTRIGDNMLEFDPTTVARTVAEGEKGMIVGAPVTTKAGTNHGAVNYALAGTDAAKFMIDQKTGQITTMVDLNFDAAAGADDNCVAQNACVVTVSATDASGDAAPTPGATVNIALTNVNEKPMFTETAGTALSPMRISSPENRAALFDTTDGPVLTEAGVTYQATDPEGLNVNLTLMGPDADMFALSSTGVLSFKEGKDREMPTDANGDNVYALTIRASDGTLNEDRMVMVTVTGVDEAPVISAGASIRGSSSISYAENGTGDVATYEVVGLEAGETASWSLSGNDAGEFRISNSGVLTFASRPDFENPDDANEDNVYEVTVMAGDAMLAVRVTVTDVDDMPTGRRAAR